ncbi:MAG: hypothetical protein ABSC94_33295 [Polyangiaceae bacterium]|jgi:hypothetical protein
MAQVLPVERPDREVPACTNHLLRRLVVGHGGKDLLDGDGADEQHLCMGQNKRRISSG